MPRRAQRNSSIELRGNCLKHTLYTRIEVMYDAADSAQLPDRRLSVAKVGNRLLGLFDDSLEVLDFSAHDGCHSHEALGRNAGFRAHLAAMENDSLGLQGF